MPYSKPLPKSNFYAVIFSSTKSEDLEGYAHMDALTMQLAEQQEGYLGYESISQGKHSIFISYWLDRESIEKWRKNATHQLAKSDASKWYQRYLSQICLVESSHEFTSNANINL